MVSDTTSCAAASQSLLILLLGSNSNSMVKVIHYHPGNTGSILAESIELKSVFGHNCYSKMGASEHSNGTMQWPKWPSSYLLLIGPFSLSKTRIFLKPFIS